jgi:hypothetical protein
MASAGLFKNDNYYFTLRSKMKVQLCGLTKVDNIFPVFSLFDELIGWGTIFD